jgi:membrane-bound ClpP family serine protease
VALTALRPTGKAVFDGKRVNVESEGGYIDADEEVEVVRETEGRHVVRRAGA